MLNIGVLASHEGTTLQCIVDACAVGRIQGMFGAMSSMLYSPLANRETGVSVHLVDETYDTGRVVRQVRVPAEITDSVESLRFEFASLNAKSCANTRCHRHRRATTRGCRL